VKQPSQRVETSVWCRGSTWLVLTGSLCRTFHRRQAEAALVVHLCTAALPLQGLPSQYVHTYASSHLGGCR
jgi:hypothetical protein